MQEIQETQVQSLSWEDPRRRKRQPTPLFLSGKSHGQRSMVVYSPWGLKESDNWAHIHAMPTKENRERKPIIPAHLIFRCELTIIVKYFLAWLLSLKVCKPNWSICFPVKTTLCYLIRIPPTSRLDPSITSLHPSPIKPSLNFHILLVNTYPISTSALRKCWALATESAGRLVKTQLAGPHAQSFWSSRS